MHRRLNSRKGLLDRIQEDCFQTNSLNLSALKDSERTATAQTWNVPQLTHGGGPGRRVNVLNTTSTGTVLDIRVETERVMHGDTESVDTARKFDLEAK